MRGMIIREYRCNDCGTTFESSDPVEEVSCPTCTAQEAERVFLTAPSIKSPKTAVADRTLKELASDYGMSNMSNKHGQAVRQAPAGPEAPKFTEHNPQMAAALARLGNNADGFSSVLPTLRATGGPRNWAKTPIKQ